jgi:hypothetical protein
MGFTRCGSQRHPPSPLLETTDEDIADAVQAIEQVCRAAA